MGPKVIMPAQFVPEARDWWRKKLGVAAGWPAEDICYGLAEHFAELYIEDTDAFDAVRGRSCVYLANHQVGVESYLFSIVMSGIAGIKTPVIAKAEHRQSWIGRIVSHSVAYPGMADPGLMVLVEREHPLSVATALEDLAMRMRAGTTSVLVHVEGTRARSCREPVSRLSPALLDMALAANAPVVPVRFAGGLPVGPATARLEFPVGYGRQQYRIGRPILPETLARIPYRERAQTVLAAINTLGGETSDERPAAPDPAFAQRVQSWVADSGASLEDAVIYAVLFESAHPSPAVRRLVEGARQGRLVLGSDAASRWLATLARMLFGPHGPVVVEAEAVS